MLNGKISQPLTIADMVSARQRVKSRIDLISDAYKEMMKKYENILLEIDTQIITAMDKDGLSSIRTPDGTAFFAEMDKYKVVDRYIFFDWVIANNATDVITTHVSADAIRAREMIPPGVEVEYIRQLRIRKA